MPSPQDILSDPKFLDLPVGEQLKVMRTVDPNFAGLSPKDQGTVIATSKQKYLGNDKLTDGGSFMERAFPNMTEGAKQVKSAFDPGKSMSDRASDVLEGTGKTLLPFGIGAGLANPVGAVGAIAGGLAGGAGARMAADYADADPDTKRLVGNVGELAGGGVGAKYGERPLSSLVPEWASNIKQRWDALATKNTPVPKTSGPTANRVGPDNSYQPLSPSRRVPTTDEIAFENASKVTRPSSTPPSPRSLPQPSTPALTSEKLPLWHMIRDQVRETPGPAEIGISPKNRLPRPKTPAPAISGSVDAPGVSDGAQSAAELMKAVGIGPDEITTATPEQWQMIENQVGKPFDRQEAIKHLGEISKPKSQAAPGKPAGYEAGPKTPTPDRSAAHAEILGKFLRKTKVRPEDVPATTDDAAWNLLEKQTGTVATPAVRAAAIEANRKLWAESQADLQARRTAHFNGQK